MEPLGDTLRAIEKRFYWMSAALEDFWLQTRGKHNALMRVIKIKVYINKKMAQND